MEFERSDKFICIRKDCAAVPIVHNTYEFEGWTLFFSHQVSGHALMSDRERGLFRKLFPEVLKEHGVTADGISLLFQRVTERLESMKPEIEELQKFLLKQRLEDRERDREKWQKAGLDDSDFDEEDAAYEALLSWQAQPLEDPYWQPAYTTGLVAIKGNRVIVANPDLFPTYIFDRTDQCDQVVAGGDPGEVRVVEKDVEKGAMLVVLSSAFKTVRPSDVVAAASKCFGCSDVVERLCELLPEDSRATAVVIQLLKPSKRLRGDHGDGVFGEEQMGFTEDDQENGDGV